VLWPAFLLTRSSRLGVCVHTSLERFPDVCHQSGIPRTKRRLIVVSCLAVMLAGWHGGCDEFAAGGGSIEAGPDVSADELPGAPTLGTLGGDEAASDADTWSPNERPVIRLQTTFDIFRVRVKRGFFSESGKVWNHLDEEAIPADTAIMLQRNGFRVGRGDANAWPPIRALLEQEEDLETFNTQLAVNDNQPLQIEIDLTPRDQTLFMFRADGTLTGASFPGSRNFLRVEYDVSVDEPGSVEVEVMPEVCMPIRLAMPEPQEDETQVPEPAWRHPIRVLRELAFRLKIGPEEFLAIGPSAMAHQGYLAGSQILCEIVDGVRYESMYFITPRLYRMNSLGASSKEE
jgi:hypothetical protein